LVIGGVRTLIKKYFILIFIIALSCTLEEAETPDPVEIIEITELEVAICDLIEYTIHGVYSRSLGSMDEVYYIGDQLVICIINGSNSSKEIYRSDYIYTDTDIIIDGQLFDYVLYQDRIVICGYVYYRQ